MSKKNLENMLSDKKAGYKNITCCMVLWYKVFRKGKPTDRKQTSSSQDYRPVGERGMRADGEKHIADKMFCSQIVTIVALLCESSEKMLCFSSG